MSSYCIVYLASPRDFTFDSMLRIDILRGSLHVTRQQFPNTDIYIFHEDYTDDDKKSLPGVKEFIQVDFTSYDKPLNPAINRRRGYMMMCRFFSGVLQSHPLIQSYTHYLRLDDDSFLLKPYLTESYVQNELTKYDYVYRCHYNEDGCDHIHQKLYLFTLDFLRESGHGDHIKNLDTELRRNGFLNPDGTVRCWAPYNNFHMASLRFWNNDLIRRYIDKIESTNGFLHDSFFDTTVQAMMIRVLTLFIGMKITADTSFGYRHNCHFGVMDGTTRVHHDGTASLRDHAIFKPESRQEYHSQSEKVPTSE